MNIFVQYIKKYLYEQVGDELEYVNAGSLKVTIPVNKKIELRHKVMSQMHIPQL